MRAVTRDAVTDPERLFHLLIEMRQQLISTDEQGKQASKKLAGMNADVGGSKEKEKGTGVLTNVQTGPAALVKLGVDTVATRQSNMVVTVDPTTSDDNSKGYQPGSIWISQIPTAGPSTTYTVWMLANAQTSAARWVNLGQLVITPGP